MCALIDQSSHIQWYNGVKKWTGAGGSTIGNGQDNTSKLISALGATETDYAAGVAKAYKGGVPIGFYQFKIGAKRNEFK